MVSPSRPLPLITHLSGPFWKAAKQHKTIFQKCSNCGAFQWYPKAWCIDCGSLDLRWTEVNAQGTLYSFTIVYHTRANPAFSDDVPFCVGAVELDVGPRMYGTIVDCSLEHIKIGMRVEITYDDISQDISLPKFKPIGGI